MHTTLVDPRNKLCCTYLHSRSTTHNGNSYVVDIFMAAEIKNNKILCVVELTSALSPAASGSSPAPRSSALRLRASAAAGAVPLTPCPPRENSADARLQHKQRRISPPPSLYPTGTHTGTRVCR